VSAASYLGLDVGGTQVKAGVLAAAELARVDGPALVARTVTLDTHLEDGVDAFLDRLAAFAREVGSGARVGLGFPGVFHPVTGRLVRSANLRAVEGRDLAAELGARLSLPARSIAVQNDANLATYGEQWLGAGRGARDLVLLTLGTGVGGGIVLDGRLFTGPGGQGAEIGHAVLRSRQPDEPEEEGLRCGCGAYGCLERLVSATAAQRRARRAGLGDDLERLAERAREGEPAPRALFHAVGRDLGAGLLTVSAILDVGLYLIGGGFGAALDLLLPGLEDAYGERDYGAAPPRILPAELGGAAGWIGAARWAAEADGRTVPQS